MAPAHGHPTVELSTPAKHMQVAAGRPAGVWACPLATTLKSDALHGRSAAQGMGIWPRRCHVSHLLGLSSCSFHFALRAVVLGNVSPAIYAFLHRGTASPRSRASLLARRRRPPAPHLSSTLQPQSLRARIRATASPAGEASWKKPPDGPSLCAATMAVSSGIVSGHGWRVRLEIRTAISSQIIPFLGASHNQDGVIRI